MMMNTSHFAEKYIITLTCQNCRTYLIWIKSTIWLLLSVYFLKCEYGTNNFITINGSDTFTYTLQDEQGGQSIGNVTVNFGSGDTSGGNKGGGKGRKK